MLGSLSAAVSGLDAFQQDMNVIGNNIANVNTDGFKAGTIDLADSFSNTLLAATGATSSSSGNNAMQVGTGVTIDAISSNWASGTLGATNNSQDLAIYGNGFFVVKDPKSTNTYATQVGNFTLDSNGYLVTQPDGYQIQGYGAAGGVVNSTVGPIQVGNSSTISYSVSPAGVVTMDNAGTPVVVGQVLLQNFQDPSALQSVGANLYSGLATAGASALTTPGSSGLGTIMQGNLELSNVNLPDEMANLITAQRGFEANSKIVTASSEMLQTVVNMVH